MTPRVRTAVVVLLVLAQLGGMRAVFCEEGSGRRVLELLTSCCGTTAPTGDHAPADGGSCGPCRDLPAVAVLQKEDDEARAPVASAIDAAATRVVVLVPRDARAGTGPAHDPVTHGVPDLVGTIVLTC